MLFEYFIIPLQRVILSVVAAVWLSNLFGNTMCAVLRLVALASHMITGSPCSQ